MPQQKYAGTVMPHQSQLIEEAPQKKQKSDKN